MPEQEAEAGDKSNVNETEFTVGELKDVATDAAKEAATEVVDERLRTDESEELRAIARHAGDEPMADEVVEGYEKSKTRWEKMDSQTRARLMGQAFSGNAPTHKSNPLSSENKFVRSIPFILRSQLEGRGDWHDIAEKAGTGIDVDGRTHKDEQLAGFLKDSLQAGEIDGAGSLIPTEMAEDVIEFLYATTVLRQMGARTLGIEGTSFDFSKMESTANHFWVGEGFSITSSRPTLKKKKLDLKGSGIIVKITNKALRAVPMGLDQIVEDDMVRVAELGEDIAGIRGTGNSNVPTGISEMIADDNSFSQSGTSTGDIVFDLMKLRYKVAGKDVPMLEPGWILSERSRHYLLQLRDSDDNLVSFMEMLAQGMLFGDPVYSTSQIPTNLGGTSDETELYFGDASQLIIGEGADMQISEHNSGTVGNDNLITQDMQALRLTRQVDFLLRHPEAFAQLHTIDFDASLDS